ncbi:MAG: GntR family transcriptional regulator [Oscillospiraceae bacterium]|nr:GntR family transcriptional regulator [Candidatus Limimonas coprohippi]
MVNKQSAIPLYNQVLDGIKAKIEAGNYKVDQKIPTEPELCEEYGVSRITVRRAVEELEREGLLIRRQGKGTFVSEKSIKVIKKAERSFSEACVLLGKEPSAKVLGARVVPATQEDKDCLGLPDESKIVEIDRLRYADGDAVLLERNHFPMVFSYLLESNLTGSLYEILHTYGVRPSWSTKEVSLITADKNKASLLGITKGNYLIYIKQTVYDQKDRPLHTSDMYVLGEKFTLKI